MELFDIIVFVGFVCILLLSQVVDNKVRSGVKLWKVFVGTFLTACTGAVVASVLMICIKNRGVHGLWAELLSLNVLFFSISMGLLLTATLPLAALCAAYRKNKNSRCP